MQGEREDPQAKLACRVRRCADACEPTVQRGYIYDRAAACFLDIGQRETTQDDGCLEVHVDNTAEVCGGHVPYGPSRMEACVIDENVDPPEFELCFLEEVDACILIGHIHREDLDTCLVT